MTQPDLSSSILLPEWSEQEAIILAWPDDKTDWAPWLDQVRQTYVDLIRAISDNQCGILLLVRDSARESAQQYLQDIPHVVMLSADYNDTWVRDYGFLTLASDVRGQISMQPVEFVFNGWGNKFNASKDNAINQSVLSPLCKQPVHPFDCVVEGGALEIDGQGLLLSTTLCLTNPQRNGQMSLQAYEEMFKHTLGARQLRLFEHGHLEGDDTDGHIDTLVRFTLEDGVVVQSCFNRPDDSHFKGLSELVAECRHALPSHRIYELPLPEIHNEDGDRLPASYANYLINNGQILFPVYQQPEDALALETIKAAYPSFRIIPINSLPLVQQFGSIHCISMQVPTGTLKADISEQFNL